MDRLRAPWRRAYVTARDPAPGCVLCQALERRAEEDSLVLRVEESAFALMNLYPYSSGHVMVALLRHVERLGDAGDAELLGMMALARRVEAAIQEEYRPDGFNLGINLGRVAGAGVEGHLHLHVVPRWSGDVNFMTVTADTRVIPEDAREACRRLRARLR
jgi:ATP adenylyltransferase